jgi:putative ABC transport system permease protein
MRTPTQVFRRALFWLNIKRRTADLAAEIEHHRAQTQAALEADGLPPAEAAVQSRRAMGNVTLAREEARDVWLVASLARLWRDVKYGARGLRREPMFAVTACLTLAAGMAIATTAFSVVDAELWKPLPFPAPHQLVVVYPRAPGVRGSTERISGADWHDWQAQSHAFSDMAAVGDTTRRVLRRDSADSVWVTFVTSNYFSVLGGPMLIGRGLDDGADGGARAAVLSERIWRRLFDGDSSVLGRRLTIDDQPVVILGVRPGAQAFSSDADVFVAIDAGSPDFRDRARRNLNVIGRLRPGVTAAAAQAEMEAVAARITQEYPDGRTGHKVYVSDLKSFDSGYNWRPLYFFLSAAGLVMLLTCVNVAGLVLARALRRGREFALRGALGGGRGALVGQLLVEGALLALPGGALGLLLTIWALRIVSRLIPPDFLARGSQVPVDARVCLAAFALAGVTTIVFGMVPALFARRVDLNGTLGQGGRTAGQSPGQARARHGLLAAQLAVTVILLVAAGVFVRSFIGLTQLPIGFDPRDAVALRVSLTGPGYGDDAQIRGYAAALLERARGVAGVRDAAIGSSTPLGSGPLVFFVVPGRPRPAPSEEPRAIVRSTSPEYFRVLGIPLTAGRPFDAADTDGAPRVTIVNQTLAARLFPGEDPIGRAIELIPGARSPWTRRPGRLTIIGVSANVKEIEFNETEFNDIYVPFAQMAAPTFDLVARAGVPASTVLPALRAASSTIDPRLPISSLSTLEQRVDDALREDRFNLLMVTTFAATALLLASIGIFGALAYAVQERRREFGVRIALGAGRRAIVRAAVGPSVRVAGAGGLAGIGVTLMLARIIGSALYLVPGDGGHRGLLYGVTTTDPIALAAAVVALTVVATVAAVVPASQATRVDPLVALRIE